MIPDTDPISAFIISPYCDICIIKPKPICVNYCSFYLDRPLDEGLLR